MSAAVLFGFVLLAAVALGGVLATAMARRLRIPQCASEPTRRLSASVDALTRHLGRPLTALVVASSGFTLTIALCWPLGLFAHAIEGSVDWPVFRWFQARQVDWWSSVWWILTDVGSLQLTRVLTLAGAAVVAIVWLRRGRRWWVPVVVMLAGHGMEYFGQEILKLVVDRGHPPTTLGTFPSGGCARVIVVYGLLIFLVLWVQGVTSARWWVAGGAVVTLLVTVEAYARTYNLEHWVTDVFGGVIFGALLLLLMVATAIVLEWMPHSRSSGHAGHGTDVFAAPKAQTLPY